MRQSPGHDAAGEVGILNYKRTCSRDAIENVIEAIGSRTAMSNLIEVALNIIAPAFAWEKRFH
jgi:hypothetical protein